MARNKPQSVRIPKKVNDLVEFFETHDMGEYLEQMPEVQFEIDIKKEFTWSQSMKRLPTK